MFSASPPRPMEVDEHEEKDEDEEVNLNYAHDIYGPIQIGLTL